MITHLFLIAFLFTFDLFCETVERTKSNIDHWKQAITTPSPWLKSREQLISLLPKEAVVAEIGVLRGDFSSQILELTKPEHLFLIDCWDLCDFFEAGLSDYQLVVSKFDNNPKVSIIKNTSSEAAKNFPDNYFDWVYIDANHSYDAVKNDLETWFPKVKNGGFISGHDYFVPGTPGTPNYYSYLVVPAVNEFVAKYNLEITYLTNEPIASYAIQIRK